MVKGLEGKIWKDWLRSLGVPSMEQRSWGEPSWLLQLLTGSSSDSNRSWQNGMELCQGRFGLGFRERSFTARVVGHWDRLTRAVVTAPSWRSSRSVWTAGSERWLNFPVVLCGARSWTRWPLWVPSSSGCSVILWSWSSPISAHPVKWNGIAQDKRRTIKLWIEIKIGNTRQEKVEWA